jgi:mono/diheme cytochrome c family protein
MKKASVRKPALLLLITLSIPFVANDSPAGDIDAGRLFALQNCARCHAIGKSGPSPFANAPPFRELPNRYRVSDLAEAFAEGIFVGHDAMPEFALPPRTIDDLLSYIDSLATK